VEATRTLVSRPPVVLYGDQALMDLAARRASYLDQLVGPYSRAGFHHPGPAVFYVLAPFVRLLGSSGSGLYLGAIFVNLAALTASVALVWHRAGPKSALWAAVSTNLFCLCLGIGTLREPWNPYLIVAPMVLFVVLWASAMTGSGGSGIWTLVVGSYEIQTHIATTAVVAVMSTVLVVSFLTKRRGRFPGRRVPRRVGHWVGLIALGLIWLPPAVELTRDRPNNLQLLWTFFSSSHPQAPWGAALRVSADALTILPFGYHDYVLTAHRSAIELIAAAALVAAAAVVALRYGRRRQTPMAEYLLIAAGIGAILGPLSLTRSDGPVYLYFAVWLSFVPLAVFMASGLALLAPAAPTRSVPAGRRSPWRRPNLAVAAAVLAGGLAGATVVSDLALSPLNRTIGSGPWPLADATSPQARHLAAQDTAVLFRAADRVLRPGDSWAGVTIGSESVWPYAAGLVLELDQDGVQTTVSPASWQLYFGHERIPGRPVNASFALYPVSDLPVPLVSGASVLTEVDGVALVFSRPA
jgi:hypothetical protein